MKRQLAAVFVLTIVLTFISSAQASFLPQEVLTAAPSSRIDSSITESQFNETVSTVQKAFAPIVSASGNTLSISGDWKNSKMNAGSRQLLNYWQVYITGAIARRPEMTTDALALILCHEMGHHLGGFPFIPSDNPFQATWAAAEGEADYFSTQVCPHLLWKNMSSENAAYRTQVNSVAKVACDGVWTKQDDRDICYRASVGAEAVAATMAGILKKPAPRFDTPEATRVPKTNVMYPSIQCRMDTLLQGDLCAAEFDLKNIPGKKASGGVDSLDAEREASRTSCMTASGYSIGLRPACWFIPRL